MVHRLSPRVHRLAALLAVALVAALLVPAGLGSPAGAQPDPDPDPAPLERISGPTRVETAVAVAQAGWDEAETVVLASSERFPDALAGVALAAQLDAPILLTPQAQLVIPVQEEIRRLDPDNVVILGGLAAVGAAAESVLADDGIPFTRVAGSTRFGTAAAIALEAGAPTGEVVLATGTNFPDALAAGGLAAAEDGLPTLLTAPTALSGEAGAALEELEAERVYVLGGGAAVAPAVVDELEALGYEVERLGGPTRYDTAALAAAEALQRRGGRDLRLVAATGDRFPDALAAGAFAARQDALLALVPGTQILNAPRIARLVGLSGERFDAGFAIGGSAAISETVAEAIEALINTPAPERVPTVTGTGGAAATVHPLVTEVALLALALGGNAVDATVAAAGVLGVVQPYSAGIGGGGFMVIRTPEGDLTTIDSREEAPAAFDNQVFLDDEGNAIPFTERVVSGLGVGVPGTVAGWELALAEHGTMDLDELMEPAVEYARYGFPIDPTLATQTAGNEEKFATFTSTRDLYLRFGVPTAGDWLRNPDLADTYTRIAADGSAAFYTGDIAADLVAAVNDPPVAPDADRVVRPSPMTVDDVAGYEALEREPVVSTFRDVTYVGMGLPSSAGPTTALALNMLETFDEGAEREEVLHRYLESLRLAWADRNGFMGDPAFVDVPLEGLLSESYAAERAALIDDTAATEQRTPGDPWAHQDDDDGASGAMVETAVDGSTTHLTVADADGMVVAYTFTIESIGGSGIVVPGRGFLLNNELTDFDPVPPHPNEPAGGKRPRSSMAPTIILQDGEPLMALGTPGGATIITTVMQIIVDVVENDRSLPDALAAPRISNFNPADLQSNAEAEFFGTSEHAALVERGHEFNQVAEQGAATGIAFGPDGEMTAVAEPVRRGAGSAGVLQPTGVIIDP